MMCLVASPLIDVWPSRIAKVCPNQDVKYIHPSFDLFFSNFVFGFNPIFSKGICRYLILRDVRSRELDLDARSRIDLPKKIVEQKARTKTWKNQKKLICKYVRNEMYFLCANCVSCRGYIFCK
jgi:hypothetical protein